MKLGTCVVHEKFFKNVVAIYYLFLFPLFSDPELTLRYLMMT